MARLVVVSNRVSVPTRGDTPVGGLEVAVRAVFAHYPGVWFGWSGRVVPQIEGPARTLQRTGLAYIVTDLTEEDYQEYYNGFANRVLWPILHYRLDLAEYTRRDLSGYLRVNEYFAAELHNVLQPDDIVWVHDYHLLPLAKALRDRGHRNKIGFFLHIPLPPPEILTALPNHEQLFPAMGHYDLIGFQTEIDTANFVRYLTQECQLATDDGKTFTVDGRKVRIGTYPVGVNTEELGKLAERAVGSSYVRNVIESLANRTMIIGVDRLDYSKGIPQRMEAFERFLATNPEWRNKVTYLQITPKSRSKIPEYMDMAQQVSTTAGRINGAYSDASWTPIRYVNRSHSRHALAGLYRSSRVGLVTPLRDGMNLVGKEYVSSQDPNDPGVLVLSRFTGTALECRSALLVNPHDPEAVGAAIGRALSMPLDERRERHAANMKVLAANDIRFWGNRFIADLTGTPLPAPAAAKSQQNVTASSNKVQSAAAKTDARRQAARGGSDG